MINAQTSFTKNVIKKAEFDNLASMNRDRNGDSFIWKGLLDDVVASFNALAYKVCFFEFAHKFFASDAWQARHQIATSRDSRMSLRYSLKACLMPIVFMYPRTASLRFPIASSGSSPCDIMSNSGQYTVYPPLRGSGISSAEICNRCIVPPPARSIAYRKISVKWFGGKSVIGELTRGVTQTCHCEEAISKKRLLHSFPACRQTGSRSQ